MLRRASAASLLFAAVALLALLIHVGLTAVFDRALLLALSPPAALVPLVSAITWFGDSLTRIIITALAALALLVGRDWRRALALVSIVAVGAALDSAIKTLVSRPRPALLSHLDQVTSASFPSGHAANSAILYLALTSLAPPPHRRLAHTLAGLLVAAIGASRIVLAVHWPSDVLAGWCFGVGWVLLWQHRLERPGLARSPG